MVFLTSAFLLVLTLAPAQTSTPKSIPPPADVAAPPGDATKTASGLATKVITNGTGNDHPIAEDLVRVHYTGWKTEARRIGYRPDSPGRPDSPDLTGPAPPADLAATADPILPTRQTHPTSLPSL